MSKYNIGVWDIQFYKSDDDGNELRNPDGSVKLFRHKYEHDVSFIAEGTTEEELEEIENDYRDCEVCTKPFNIFHDEQGLLDLQEILDCTDQQLAVWQNENPDIDLTSYFCSKCATDTIKDIEGLERNGELSFPEHLESYHEKK